MRLLDKTVISDDVSFLSEKLNILMSEYLPSAILASRYSRFESKNSRCHHRNRCQYVE